MNALPLKQTAERGFKALPALGMLLVALMLGPSSSHAADTNSAPAKVSLQGADNGKGKGKSKPVISERPEVLGSTSTTASGDSTKPARPTTGNDDPQTEQLLQRFQSARTSYLQAQKELNLASKNATEAQRALLREQSKEALAKWREEHRRFAEEQQERMKTIKSELQAEMAPRIDNSGDGLGGGRSR